LKRRKETNSWKEDAAHDKLLQQNDFISPEGSTLLSMWCWQIPSSYL